MNDYVPLNVRSSYSIGDSICQIPRLVRKARELGLSAIAIADANMFGAKEFHDACLSMRARDYGNLPPVKPIIGLAVRIRERGVDAPLVLLAKNKDGYHNLVRIVSENSVHGKSGELVVPLDSVLKRNNGVICLADGGTEYLMLSEEMFAMLPRHPEWMENTRRLAIEIEEYDLNEIQEVVAFPIPPEFPSSMAYLRHLVAEGAERRWGTPLPKEASDRLEFELSTIERFCNTGCCMDFASYFLVVQDYVAAARRMGVWVGPGRGSAAGSAVVYALGITNVDPVRHGLLSERFINPDLIAMPDIDIDFDDLGREKVLQYIAEKYGRDHVAHIVSFGPIAPKSVIKDVSCAKGKLEGCVRQSGIHPCGIVVSPRPLSEVLPVSAIDKDCRTPNGIKLITQYDGRHVETVGLLRFDIVRSTTLSLQKLCVELIKERMGQNLDLEKIPDNDPKAMQVFARGDTMGIFLFESEGMRKCLRALKPTSLNDIVAMSVLYRPGLMEYIPAFIRRKNGEEPIAYAHPLMEDVLRETYGVTIYQEQVMLLSRILAGFSRGVSDQLRKAMGKKRLEIIEELKIKFVDGCLGNAEFRVGKWADEAESRKLIDNIWGEWYAIASYAFNKSHAVAYTWLAYQSAYLKAHYPEEFGSVQDCRAPHH